MRVVDEEFCAVVRCFRVNFLAMERIVYQQIVAPFTLFFFLVSFLAVVPAGCSGDDEEDDATESETSPPAGDDD